MNKILSALILTAAIAFLISPVNSATAQSGVDNSIYSKLLAKYVHDGVVDYQGFKKNEARLDDYLSQLAAVNAETLSSNEKMAYYINLYNASTIKLILTGYPGISSIKDLGSIFSSPWKKKFVKINNGQVSLDHIEQDILRPTFKDPRIHFAVNCASKSCPPLLNRPFEGEILNQQLNEVTQAFINNPKNNYIQDGTLYASRIFKWYGGDFKNGVVAFFLKFAQGDLKKKIENTKSSLPIEYLDYDWSLNGK